MDSFMAWLTEPQWTCFGEERLKDRQKPSDEVYIQKTKPAPMQTQDDVFREALSRFETWKPMKPLSHQETLTLYALRMQAEYGDVQGAKPALHRPEARAKWFAWAQLEGEMTKTAAMRKFCEELRWMMHKHGSK